MNASIKDIIAFIWALTRTFLKFSLVADSPIDSATTLFDDGFICLQQNIENIVVKIFMIE